MAKRPIIKEVEPDKVQKLRTKLLRTGVQDPSTSDVNHSWQPWDGKNVLGIHSTPELLEAAKRGEVEIEAKVIARNKEGTYGYRKLDRAGFIESHRNNSKRSFKEAVDYFNFDTDFGGNLVGQDFIPLLGGPFNKQLYYYDYLKMHALCFFAYHHDPVAHFIVNCTTDFTLGRGYRVDCDNPAALALWRAFEDVNDLQAMMRNVSNELSWSGEQMFWWLPNNATKIGYQLRPGQEVPKGLIPRVRQIDPSVIWEVVTFPEDITRVISYVWVAPTQYQLYTGSEGGSQVPSTKFIYQHIPAAEVDHFKINCASNEKRGRSDLFPCLNYLKRLRDSVDYSLVAMQKQSAWAIDTTIEGSQSDVDAYVSEMERQGTIPQAGSEFAHTSAIKREMLAPMAGSKGNGQAFEWALSMIAAGSGIPVNYFGTHLGGATTRASALVATEPVAKKFENRQTVLERMIKRMAKRLFDQFGIKAEIEVTFPELISQDRSSKLKDLAAAQSQGWISKKRAAQIAAKELGVTEFNYEEEIEEIKAEEPMFAPLTLPPQYTADEERLPKPSQLTQDERRDIKTDAKS